MSVSVCYIVHFGTADSFLCFILMLFFLALTIMCYYCDISVNIIELF